MYGYYSDLTLWSTEFGFKPQWQWRRHTIVKILGFLSISRVFTSVDKGSMGVSGLIKPLESQLG
jgi:hypothetical protein